LSKYDLTALFKGRGGPYVPASTVQCLADRLDKALKAFLEARDEQWGFPRFVRRSKLSGGGTASI